MTPTVTPRHSMICNFISTGHPRPTHWMPCSTSLEAFRGRIPGCLMEPRFSLFGFDVYNESHLKNTANPRLPDHLCDWNIYLQGSSRACRGNPKVFLNRLKGGKLEEEYSPRRSPTPAAGKQGFCFLRKLGFGQKRALDQFTGPPWASTSACR